MKSSGLILILTFFLASAPAVAETPTETPFEELSAGQVLEKFSQKLNSQKSMMESIVAGFSFPDRNEDYTIKVSYGKADFSQGAPQDPDFSLRINDALWQRVMRGEITIYDAISNPSPDITFMGSKPTFVKFMALFDKTENTKIRRY